ncbi:RluA family pseudouridine synthase [Bacillus carboniphilus]|uniref:Pseudouridine synthase n=1 Tax=Bacillus carboniphilus TaxID=86663 RepID=A0ABN0W7H7_9BACI
MKVSRQGPYISFAIKSEWEGFTLQEVFKSVWPLPKKMVHLWRMERYVLVNGQEPNWNVPLQKSDQIKIKLLEDQAFALEPLYAEIPILFEDDHCLVANKPAGMKTHPTEEEDEITLLNGVSFHSLSSGELRRIRHIHRLDKDTTGAVLFSKHELAGALLDEQLTRKEVHRTYWAIVDGCPKQKKGTINKAIGRDRHHPTRRRVSPSGQAAVTHYEVLEYNKRVNRSLVQCKLETGRTHQIRVHLQALGHPLVGDELYGGSRGFYRPVLHATDLSFTHPLTEERIRVKAPLLDNMMDLIK